MNYFLIPTGGKQRISEKNTDIEVKRDPGPAMNASVLNWESMRSFRHQIHGLMVDFELPDLRRALACRSPLEPNPWPRMEMATPPIDLVERSGGFELLAEVPGLSEVMLSNGMVTIKGFVPQMA